MIIKKYTVKKSIVFLISFIIFFQGSGIQFLFINALNNEHLLSTPNYIPYTQLNSDNLSTAKTEMIIITNNSDAVEDFAQWKTMKGTPTFIATVEAIETNYTSGITSERIHAFLRDAYQDWENLSYVLLAGGENQIPLMRIYLNDSREGWGLNDTYKPTDFYYACLDDTTWDDDGDSVFGECTRFNIGGIPIGGPDEIDDWVPDVFLGRVPFDNYADVHDFLDRVIAYETDPLSGVVSPSSWDDFLMGGGVLNYDEQVNAWNNSDATDDAELCDYIIDNALFNNYTFYNYFENRTYFWDYIPTHPYSNLSRENIVSGIDTNDPPFLLLSGHGGPMGIYRLFDSSGSPYGERKMVNSTLSRITGIKVGDADNLDGDEEIVAVTSNGAVLFYDGSWENGWMPIIIANLGNSPSCVAIGDCDNDGANEVAVGAGPVVYVYEYIAGVGWNIVDTTVNNPTADDILCIYIGPTEEYDEPQLNNEIAVGDIFGQVTLYQWSIIPIPDFLKCIVYLNGAIGDPYIFSQVDCIKGEDFDGDGKREIIFGAQGAITNGVFAIQGIGNFLAQPPVSWPLSDIWVNTTDWAISLDSGDPDNDLIEIEVIVGTNNANVLMFENWTFQVKPNPLATVITIDSNAGSAVEGIAVGDVDENSVVNEIIAGTIGGILRKYVAVENGAFYVIDKQMNGYGVDSLAIGFLDDDSELSHKEIVIGTTSMLAISYPIFAYQWPVPYDMKIYFNIDDAYSITKQIPALTFIDSCTTAAFDYNLNTSLAEAMLQNGVSIIYIGSLRTTWYYYGNMSISLSPGNKGGNRAATFLFWQSFYNNTNHHRASVAFYDMVQTYHSSYDVNAFGYHDDLEHRKNVLTYTFLGDPELDIYTKRPDTFKLDIAESYYIGDSLYVKVQSSDNSFVPGAKVCIQGSNFYIVGETDAQGGILISLAAEHLIPNEILTYAISKHNFVTKIGQFIVYNKTSVITITTPTIAFNKESEILTISNVVATCNNSLHGYLNANETIYAAYLIYTHKTNQIILEGNLSYNANELMWEASNINLTTLSEGRYYVRCQFVDADASGESPPSQSFVIGGILFWIQNYWWILVIGGCVLLLLIIIPTVIVRRKKRV